MWKSYLSVGFRTLRRDKSYAAINILGLAAGIAVCLVVAIVVRHSISYDRFHSRADRIYRVILEEVPMLDFGTTLMPRGLAGSLEERLPGVERVVALFNRRRSLVSVGESQIYVDRVYATDDQFFQTFSFPLRRGDRTSVLTEPGEVVLTESVSRRLFGDEDAIGRTIMVENPPMRAEYRVVAIADDAPGNSHLQFDVLVSMSATERAERHAQTIEWGRFDYHLYVLFREGVGAPAAQAAMAAFGSDAMPEVWLEPMTRTHLYSDPTLNADIAVKSDVRYLFVLSGIAVLTLLIACVSYINLAIAGGAHRAREAGVRKVLGAHRRQLAAQYLTEAVLTVLLAVPIAIGAAHLALPHVGNLIGEELTIHYFSDASVLLALLGIVLIVGIAAGCYPAVVLSRMRPVRALSGGTPLVGRARRGFRTALMGFQFVVTIGLIICALVMHNQIEYVQEQRLGTEGHIILIVGREITDDDAPVFKRQLERQSHVMSVATGLPPGLDGGGLSSTTFASTDETVWLKRIRGDEDYLSTLGLHLIAGQNFSADGPDDQGYIINETAARLFDIAMEEVGTRMKLGSWDDVLIRGIVADFHHRTLHEPIQPLYMAHTSVERSTRGYFMVRLHGSSISQGLDQVGAVWNRFVPNRPFDYSFLDERVEQQYTAEHRLIQIFSVFSGLAILLACLGLFGLGAYTIERRMKEISIRKVMGASSEKVFVLLSRDLLTPGLIAGTIAIPIAYVAMHRWLEGFAYRIAISGWVLAAATAIALFAAWLAVSFHLVRIARVNPARILRYE